MIVLDMQVGTGRRNDHETPDVESPCNFFKKRITMQPKAIRDSLASSQTASSISTVSCQSDHNRWISIQRPVMAQSVTLQCEILTVWPGPTKTDSEPSPKA